MTAILFRVDANESIGSGHFWRCLALAIEARRQNAKTFFAARFCPDGLIILLEKYGVTYLPISGATEAFYKAAAQNPGQNARLQRADAAATLEATKHCPKFDWVVVDHYALGTTWEKAMVATGCKILVIDDLHNRRHYCDLLLDQNLIFDGESYYRKFVPKHCELLLGPRFNILRGEFATAYRQKKEVQQKQRMKLLVSFGGSDSENHTMQVIKAVRELKRKKLLDPMLQVQVVIGGQNRHRQLISRYCEKHDIQFHYQTNKMANLMANADLAIGGGGLELWERCSMGLPTIVFETAANQKTQLEHAARAGLVYCPDREDSPAVAIRKHLPAFFANANLRYLLRDRCSELFDFQGPRRIISRMNLQNIRVRKVTLDDAKLIYDWRNSPTVREFSLHSGAISFATHKKWLEEKIKSRKSVLLLGLHDEKPFGVLRYDVKVQNAEVSIYLDPAKKGAGYGGKLLVAGDKYLMENYPFVSKIEATVLANNFRSMHMFENHGYARNAYVLEKHLGQN